MKNKSKTVRIPCGGLWKSPYPFAEDATGKKTHMCWPTLENTSWLQEVKDIVTTGDTPTYVTHQNGKSTWHFKLSCYHGGEGWWYEWDDERSAQSPESYRMFIPSELKFHPNYLAPSDKNSE